MAATKQTPAALETVMSIALADIIPTADNSRQVSPKDPKTIALAESIKINGVQVPALGRMHPTQAGKIDLRAGHRRHVAAGLAGLATMPVIIREMTDDEALRTTILENVREPLSPIQEAGAIERMQARGWTGQQIADTLGISTQTVAKRKNLLALSPKWRKLLEAGEDGAKGRVAVHNWPPAYFELIARLPESVQDSLIKDDWQFLNHHKGWTLRDLENYLDGMQQALKAAPWELADASLVKGCVGCDLCPKRTSAQPDLFGGDGEDRCLDPVCWTQKKHAWVERQAEAAATEHKGLILMQEGWNLDNVPAALRKKPLRHKNALKRVSRTAIGAKPALLVDGPDAGKTLWVAEDGGSGRGAAKREPGQKKTLAERLAALEKRRQKHVIAAVKGELERVRQDEHACPMTSYPEKGFSPFLRLAAHFGLRSCLDIKAAGAKGMDLIEAEIALAAIEAALSAMPEWDAEGNWRRAGFICDVLGIDIVALCQVAEAEIKTPKSILQEQEQAKLEKKAEKPKAAKKAARKGKGKK